MSKAKKKKKSKEKNNADEAQTEESRAAHLQRVTEQMHQLAELRTLVDQSNTENVNLRNKVRQIDRDNQDLIAFLTRQLGQVCEEVNELVKINKALEDEKSGEKEEFLRNVKSKEQSFNEMQEHLSSEIKALNGRLSNLDEYREQRDFLLDKNKKMEAYLQTMERRAHAMEKEFEKANLIDKDRMRREMEKKLTKFSIDFQRATKVRTAAATQNVIKENIAINNELALLIISWQKLHDSNELLKESNRIKAAEISVTKDILDQMLQKNVAQAESIDRLAYEHIKLDQLHTECDGFRNAIRIITQKIEEKQKEITESTHKIEQIKQEEQAVLTQINDLEFRLDSITKINEKNTILINKIKKVIAEEREAQDDKKKTLSSSDVQIEKLEKTFGQLSVLFDEDWLLDVTSLGLKNLSLDTVIGFQPNI